MPAACRRRLSCLWEHSLREHGPRGVRGPCRLSRAARSGSVWDRGIRCCCMLMGHASQRTHHGKGCQADVRRFPRMAWSIRTRLMVRRWCGDGSSDHTSRSNGTSRRMRPSPSDVSLSTTPSAGMCCSRCRLLEGEDPLRHNWAICYRTYCARSFYPPSSSSNALASWRSTVSNPSVNQP